MGLVSSHAYTILDIQEVYIATKKEKKKKQRIIKMENPWGKYEWKGNYYIIQEDGLNIPMYGVNN